MIAAEGLRTVMRNLAAGVSVVTASAEHRLYGLTATSFTAVSLAPPLILVSLNMATRTHGAVESSGLFAVNILAETQAELALSFSEAGRDRFEDVPYTLTEGGLPVLDGAIGLLECEVFDRMEGGDHEVFLGLVLAGSATQGNPLLHFQGSYHKLERKEPSR